MDFVGARLNKHRAGKICDKKLSEGFTPHFQFMFPIWEKVVYTWQVGFGCGVF
ncbi:MAG: hypothetical protein M3209_07880 [Acidobacteriota bacterium]|nr:hypothetical protein [Acidobacteriota bacterium]